MGLSDTAVALTAVYGAALSTLTFYRQLKDRQRRVSIKLETGTAYNLPGIDSQKTYFTLEAANVGSVPVTLSSHGIILPNGIRASTTNAISNVAFPHQLNPGTNCQVFVEIIPILQRLHNDGYIGNVNLVPYYSDQTSKTHKGESLKIHVDEWLALSNI